MSNVTRSITIDAPPSQVWEVLADFANIHKWSPVVSHSVAAGEIACGGGASRTCSIPLMGSVTEHATAWVEGERIEIAVHGAPMIREMTSIWEVSPMGAGTRVTAQVDYRAAWKPLGAVMAATVMRIMISRQLRRSLEGLKAYVPVSQSKRIPSRRELHP
jgi:carbon monoxide dehydrogenase subunit G